MSIGNKIKQTKNQSLMNPFTKNNEIVSLIPSKQGKSEGFDSCDRPNNLTQIGFKSSIFQPVWPWNLIWSGLVKWSAVLLWSVSRMGWGAWSRLVPLGAACQMSLEWLNRCSLDGPGRERVPLRDSAAQKKMFIWVRMWGQMFICIFMLLTSPGVWGF